MHKIIQRLAVFVAVLLPCLITSSGLAHANELVDVRVFNQENHIEIAVYGKESLEEPKIRTSRGMIRVWYPHVRKDAWFDLNEVPEGMKWLKARPGARGSGLIKIRLDSHKKISTKDLQVTQKKNLSQIFIPKALLGLTSKTKEAIPTDKGRTEAAAPSHTKELSNSVEAQQIAEGEIAPLLHAQPRTSETDALTMKSDTWLNKQVTAETSSLAPPNQGMDLGMYALITALLALVYVAIRILKKGKASRVNHSDIQVLSMKRLGARHSLMIVRALGEDHFLAVHGGRTQTIASLPSADERSDQEHKPVDSSHTKREANGIIHRVKSLFGLAAPPSSAMTSQATALDTRFGDSFLSALQQTEATSHLGEQAKMNHERTKFSSLQDNVAQDRISLSTNATQSTPSSSMNRQSSKPSAMTPDTMSPESVAGILKLRNQAQSPAVH